MEGIVIGSPHKVLHIRERVAVERPRIWTGDFPQVVTVRRNQGVVTSASTVDPKGCSGKNADDRYLVSSNAAEEVNRVHCLRRRECRCVAVFRNRHAGRILKNRDGVHTGRTVDSNGRSYQNR